MRVVGIVLLHDEDVFAERVIRNVAGFCDHVHVADHASTDGTWQVVSRLAGELDNVEPVRIAHAARSHDLLQPYIGTDTWVISADGDELFDPEGLRRMRSELEAGRYERWFRLFPAMLHAVALDTDAMIATGYLSPPARSGPKLFNFAVLESWEKVYRERLHEGEPVFRDGWNWESKLVLGDLYDWDDNPFRCLHGCFLRRSSREPESGEHVRLNIGEADTYRRDLVGRIRTALRRRGEPTSWKLEKYGVGELVTKDASPFLSPVLT